ncbi:hypothetical protein [Synechococcus sp. PCC 7336]|uniref:hypothetical protein n=1 Tax=Synechococcus sp. PCC 7336 TaxID=195250 RepID=UPI000346D4C2|nr:hypothetical protein [Synechococcus sp. PCC 7336]
MDSTDRQLQVLKTRFHQQAQALAESEALAIQNIQRAAELEQQLADCQLHSGQSDLVDEIKQQLAQSESDRQQLAQKFQEVAAQHKSLAQQLAASQAEQATLTQKLQEAIAQPTADSTEALREAKRRQEVAEAHHYVLKRQYEALQNRVKELERECSQAHATGRDRERELTEVQTAKAELEEQVNALKQQILQAQAARKQLVKTAAEPKSDSGRDRILPLPGADGESKPSSSPSELPLALSSLSLPSIPPLALKREDSPVPMRKLDRRVRTLAASSAEIVAPQSPTPPALPSKPASHSSRRHSAVVDLPAFLRRG